MITMWIKSIYLYLLVASSGWLCADLFGLGLLGKSMAALGLCMLVVTSLFCGGILILQGLEHAKIRHINDGKEDVSIVLKLGPFSMTQNVPLQNTGE
ncbi:MAG: hypothetical protein RRY29_09375 [Desulfovibrionaceae bacterium]